MIFHLFSIEVRGKIMLINKLHLKAPGNWINDPNGFIYYGGKYHLFYQYFPYEPVWGTMHWGHAVSDDLVNWEHLGIAVYPTKSYDRNGVFSGSAIEIDGKMYLYYTSVVYGMENQENIHISADVPRIESQSMIISDDGFTFDNYNDKKQIIPPMEDNNIGNRGECRDPKVIKYGDSYYMALGTTRDMKTGVLLIYKSSDGITWEYSNRIESKELGYMLECPDIFEIDGRWILVSSPMGVTKDSGSYENQTFVRFISFDPELGELAIDDKWEFLDYGLDVYATQSNLDEDGRRVIISWVRMPRAKSPDSNTASGGKCWNGIMTMPRVVEVCDDEIYTKAHPNVRRYFDSVEASDIVIDGIQGRVRDGNIQLLTDISEGESISIHDFTIKLIDGCVVTDRSEILGNIEGLHMVSQSPVVGNECHLEIYEEKDIIEIYINDGRYVITNVK